MSYEACIAEFEKAAGRPLTDDEKIGLAEEVQKIVKRVAESDAADKEAAILKAVDDFGAEMVAAAVIEKRNAALNKRAEIMALDYIRSTWKDRPDKGLTAILGGVSSARQGARASVAASQEALTNHYLTGMIAALEKEGVHKVFASGAMDREIWRAMHEIAQPEPNAAKIAGLPEEAVKIAKILNDYNEIARVDANLAGAWIKKLPGRVIKQTHDQYKVYAAGWEEWRDYVVSRLDWEKTLPDAADKEAALRSIYTGLASGEHVMTKEPVAGFKGFANIGKKMSQERVLHFKDADAGFDYNQRFGVGSLSEGMLYGLEHMAQSTALMRHLGPNAELNLDAVITRISQDLHKTGDAKALQKFQQEARNLKATLWPNITGEARVAGNKMLAQVSSGVRAWQQMSSLGGAVLSAISDLPFYASEVAYQGGSFTGGLAEAVGNVVRVGKTSTEKKEVAGMLGVLYDGMRASVASRFDVSDNIPGRLAKSTQVFFKLSGLRWWTDRLRVNFALASSHRLAQKADLGWDQLGEEMTRVLGLYGIDSGKWDLIRRGNQAAADGRNYLTPEGITDLPDDAFAGYLQAKEITPTPARIRDLKIEISDQFRSYFYDRSTTAVLEPDARTRGILLRGTRPGTIEGEFLRHVMLFKSFTAGVIQKVLAREVYGRGEQTEFWKAMRNGNGEMWGLARLIAVNTAFGYLAMAAKDLAKGREPRTPDDPEELRKIFMAAMVQGGGLGIYGDFLFGEMKSRFGGGALSTLMGPTAGDFEGVVDLFQRFRDGDDTAATAFRFALNNTPFLNLFYTRWALDYLILYDISEQLNPGYLRRMEQRLQKEKDQRYIVPPSSVVPYGG